MLLKRLMGCVYLPCCVSAVLCCLSPATEARVDGDDFSAGSIFVSVMFRWVCLFVRSNSNSDLHARDKVGEVLLPALVRFGEFGV